MKKFCVRCGGEHLIKKGTNPNTGIQYWKCVTKDVNGKECGCRKTPVFVYEDEDISDTKDVISHNLKIAKKLQRVADEQRIERKSFRENTRIENAITEYIQALRDVITENKSDLSMVPDFSLYTSNTDSIGIVQLTDLHFNELVNIDSNIYDFNIATKRLRLYSQKIISDFRGRGINKVYIAMTGDLLNSDRRLDELLSLATNRASATFLAAKILSQFVLDLSMMFDVHVVSVSGNESRIRDEYSLNDPLATDNFDFMIYEIMKLLLHTPDNKIKFISGNTMEYVLNIGNKNLLITHGNNMGKMTPPDLNKVISKWAKKGVIINWIMCGHLHETLITDVLLRSGSLVGNNTYSDSGLNLSSHASQNYYILNADGSMDATRVDLQYTNGIEGYSINDDLVAYNCKSAGKTKQKTNILSIVI